VEHLFASQQYGEAGRQVYDFFWGEFADWYIEIAKLQFAEGGDRAFYTAKVLVQVFDSCLRVLHPFTPFVTEALWGHLKQTCIENFSGYQPAEGWTDALMVAAWPVSNPREGWEEQKIADFILIQEMVRAIRNLRTEKKIKPSLRIAASIAAGDKWNIINENIKVIASLAGLDENQIILKSDLAEKPLDQTALIVMGIEIYLALSDVVDAPAEQARLEKELAIATDQINRLEALLNSSFAQKAPAQVVEKERQKLAGFQETAQKIREQLT
ncbi:MAG: class I tRNA ligase family protein, partial [Anaerolineaceae bacterium]